MKTRSRCYDKPLNIYELHLGSWKKKDDKWCSYTEIADELITYLKENGYNYVEFLPLSEHPFDGSWGYQNTGFYAPTSRYGTSSQLMELIDKLHNAGIGTIMDFVPVHFALDAYGLKEYDGSALYEYPHKDVGESEWGSMNFMHSRREVACFLQSAANYWLKEYHFDGIRMDAVSRLIYWQGDEKRGVNGVTLNFLKGMNKGLHILHPDAILIAEDSTAYPGVTKPIEDGGLGFDYKWDLGWMHDTLKYFECHPYDRSNMSDKITFSIYYTFNEQYILPFSHDEVVHGKGTIINKLNGSIEQKFAQARLLYLYMMTHPGKKLNFMGNELATFFEWDEKKELDWEVLKTDSHDSFHKYFQKLNTLYLNTPYMGIAVDVTRTGDTAGEIDGQRMQVALGKGPTVKIKDSSVQCNPQVIELLRKAAKASKIPYQDEILLAGGTDTAAVQKTRAGILSGCVSIPCRNIHAPAEMVSVKDVENVGKLLAAAAKMPL